MGRAHIAAMAATVIIVITLHPKTSAGNSHTADAMRGPLIRARESIARLQIDLIFGVTGCRITDLFNLCVAQRGRLHRKCGLLQLGRVWFGGGVFEVQSLHIPLLCKLRRIRQTTKRIVWSKFGHRHSPLDHCRKRGHFCIRARNNRLFLSNKNTQANINPFRSFRKLQTSHAHINGGRYTCCNQNIRSFGALFLCFTQ